MKIRAQHPTETQPPCWSARPVGAAVFASRCVDLYATANRVEAIRPALPHLT